MGRWKHYGWTGVAEKDLCLESTHLSSPDVKRPDARHPTTLHLVLLRQTGTGRLFDKFSPFPTGTNKKNKRNRTVILLWDWDGRGAGNEHKRISSTCMIRCKWWVMPAEASNQMNAGPFKVVNFVGATLTFFFFFKECCLVLNCFLELVSEL